MTKRVQIEVIELFGEVNGFGFHIYGGKSTGCVVQAILNNGVAHRVRIQALHMPITLFIKCTNEK